MLSKTRSLLAGGVLVAVAALVAPGAAQATIYEAEYEADLELTATYTHRYFLEKFDPEYQKEVVWDAGSTVRATIPNILFRDGKLVTPKRTGEATQTATGTASVADRWWDATNQRTVRRKLDCDAATMDFPGQAQLVDGGHGPDGQSFKVRFAEVLPLGVEHCVGDAPVPDGFDLGGLMSYKKAVGEGMLDAPFTLPGETIGMGQITQLFSAAAFQKTPAFCPDKRASEIETTQACGFDWTAKITFRKVGENHFYEQWPEDVPRGDGGTPAPPQPPAGPTGPTSGATGSTSRPGGVTDPRAAAGAATRVVAPKRVVVHPNGRKLSFAAVCPAGCSGTAKVKGAGAKVLATRRFTVKAGARAVAIDLPRAVTKRARTVVVTLTPKGAAPVTSTIALRR